MFVVVRKSKRVVNFGSIEPATNATILRGLDETTWVAPAEKGVVIKVWCPVGSAVGLLSWHPA